MNPPSCLNCGSWGIRTPGTLNTYGSLANCWFQPLTHLSLKILGFAERFSQMLCKGNIFFFEWSIHLMVRIQDSQSWHRGSIPLSTTRIELQKCNSIFFATPINSMEYSVGEFENGLRLKRRRPLYITRKQNHLLLLPLSLNSVFTPLIFSPFANLSTCFALLRATAT